MSYEEGLSDAKLDLSLGHAPKIYDREEMRDYLGVYLHEIDMDVDGYLKGYLDYLDKNGYFN